MKLKLSINIKIILFILTFSVLIGVVYNTLSEKGISVFREIKKNDWAQDNNLFKNIQNDTLTVDGLAHASPKPNDTARVPENVKDSVQKTLSVKPDTKITAPQAVTLSQAYKLFKSGKALFIDARDQWDFQEGHIKASINIPYYKFDKNDDCLKKVTKSNIIITYCEGDDCGMSKKLAKNLFDLGFTNVYYFFDGWDAWINAGYPVDKSETE